MSAAIEIPLRDTDEVIVGLKNAQFKVKSDKIQTHTLQILILLKLLLTTLIKSQKCFNSCLLSHVN